MSAAMTPIEDREVVRFGMFDDEVFREIVEHHDEVPNCEAIVNEVPCSECATHAGICRACGRKVLIACTPHADELSASPEPVRHRVCGASGIDLIRMVQL